MRMMGRMHFERLMSKLFGTNERFTYIHLMLTYLCLTHSHMDRLSILSVFYPILRCCYLSICLVVYYAMRFTFFFTLCFVQIHLMAFI